MIQKTKIEESTNKSKGCTFEMTSNDTELRKNRSKYSKSKNYIENHRNRKKKNCKEYYMMISGKYS